MISRRRVLLGFAGAALAWPLAAQAQQKEMPVIGLLRPTTPPPEHLAAFRQGLAEAGYVEGPTVFADAGRRGHRMIARRDGAPAR